MIQIKNNKIIMTQGDTLDTTIVIKTKAGETYVPASADKIRFAVKSSFTDDEPLIVKEIPNDTLELRLEADETKRLEARAKPYVYDVELTKPDGTVDTFISSTMIMKAEVE